MVAAEQTFNDVSPQFAVGYRVQPEHNMAYASAARGYKAGGFNPAALPGSEAYGEEHAWHIEGGVKGAAGRRQGLGDGGACSSSTGTICS